MKKLVVPLLMIAGIYMTSAALKIGMATAFAQQEPQQEATPVQEPESKSEEKIEPMPEQKKDSIPEQKTERVPEKNQEPTPEKPTAE
jgi:hypothetical protein